MAKVRAKLIHHLGERHRELPLSKNRITIGRDATSDVVVDETGVSGHHATLEYRGGYYFLRDEESTNGTFVNDRRIRTAKLGGGESLRFGRTSRLEYELLVGPTRKVLRLVPVDGGNPIDLREGTTVVGRDSAVDLQLKSEFVSRRHAALHLEDGTVTVEDLGSSQGTFVNERSARREHVRPGDALRFADQKFRLVEAEVAIRRSPLRTGALLGISGVLAVVLLTLLVQKLLQPSELERIARELEVGLVNYDRQNYPVALDKFDKAVMLLELREDVAPLGEEETFAGFDLVRRELSPTNRVRDLDAIYGDILDRRRSTENVKTGVERRNFIEARVKALTEAFGSKNRSYSRSFVDDVDRYIALYQGKNRKTFHVLLQRSREHLPRIKTELGKARLPEIFAYLPAQESKYSPTITSKAGARGMWQFMPQTGREMGLRIDEKVDERIDPAKSTRAAVRYLRRLTGRFGTQDYLLSLAAYNWGLGRVQGVLARIAESSDFDLTRDRNYWYLVENDVLPRETAEYVSRIFAFAVLLQNPEVFGF